MLWIPFIVGLLSGELASIGPLWKGFVLPGACALLLGWIARLVTHPYALRLKDSMFICLLSWILLTILGSFPFLLMLDMAFIDACFETMSGFTTTGITILKGLESLPRSILFWRALTQWIGGLGILSMFLIMGFQGGAAANQLFLAEGHKVATRKPSPGLFHTAKIVLFIYICFTVIQSLLLGILGLNLFDAVTHTFTTISTGGYAAYDDSIAYFQTSGYRHPLLIELTFLLFMTMGGIGFFIHYRLWTGQIRALWDSSEMRMFWALIFGGTMIMVLSGLLQGDGSYTHPTGASIIGIEAVLYRIKDTLFQVVSVLTTTGFGTRDIAGTFFTPIARIIFLVFMVIGGCAGSTGGGIKVVRVVILHRLVRRSLTKLNVSRRSRMVLTVDRQIVGPEEVYRVVVILFCWLSLLLIGGGITAAFSDLSGWESLSGMFSALGNIGPCYFSVDEMIVLHPFVKLTYIFGMLAGRLEILPVLLVFSRKFFR